MLYALVPALLRYAINTPCAFGIPIPTSRPYIFVHFLEMFLVLFLCFCIFNSMACCGIWD